MSRYLNASEAATALGIQAATLYAYVSRGMLRSEPVPGTRRKGYLATDVRRLQQRQQQRRDPKLAARDALHFGEAPVLDSALTLIEDGKLYHRGLDAVEWAREHSLEETAELLWGRAMEDVAPQAVRANRLPPVAAFHTFLAAAAARDPAAFDLRPEGVCRAGTRITRGFAAIASGQKPTTAPIADVLRRGWGLRPKHAATMISRALVLCADHELNVSAFTARCIASAGSSPYAAVTGALGALEGFKHGGHSDRVQLLFDEVEQGRAPEDVLADRLRRGEPIPGYDHPLYPDGDPRAVELLDLCREFGARTPGWRTSQRILAATQNLLGEHPNLDFGLVALTRTLRIPGRAPFLLFAVGRTVGWIAHVLEQNAAGRMIRPRASYVGPRPGGENQTSR